VSITSKNLCILCNCDVYVSGFQLILALKLHDAVMIIKTITVLGTFLLELFFYSFVGDYLKCQIEEVAQSIYSCNWHSLSIKLMRNVLFVIMRSQFVVNIETFMIILKSSFSYLSLLRKMMDT